ncbi:MAG: hypothetical protein CL608_33240 [Anaerolineaceae bacterium]|nr:hypothetical protein [Anaerolineaceae bacterium]
MTDTVILINGGPTVSISGVTIQNGDASLDGGGLLVENGTVSLSDSIVQNNLAPSGAGIANNGTMTLDDVIVRNNTADEIISGDSVCDDCAGGGILNYGVMTVTNSTIHGNTANFGGGIDNAFTGTLVATEIEVYNNSVSINASGIDALGGGIENLGAMTLINSIVRDNTAPFGGGFYNEGELTITGSDLHGNTAATRGGGIHNTFNLTVQTSNVYENQAGSGGGGGISSEGGDVVVERTAVYNNSAAGSGGGIVHNVTAGSNSFAIINSTISGNSTSGSGGGLRNAGIAQTSLSNVTLRNNTSTVVAGQSISVLAGSLTTKNSIISNQTGNNCSGTITSQGYNLANDSSCGLNGTADLPNTNPLLGSLQNNGGGTLTHALLIGSPAIDSGSGCPVVDQRGVARPFGDACDRGAYEFDVDTQSVYLPFVIRP